MADDNVVPIRVHKPELSVEASPELQAAMELLPVREKIREALLTISDPGRGIDSGLGGGGADLWVTIDGVEYFVNIKRTSGGVVGAPSPA